METKPAVRRANILAVAPQRPLDERVAVIREHHQCAMTSLAQGAMYALMCGFELHAARAQIKHGGWEQWVEANCPFALRTAYNYMQAAERKFKQIPNLQHVADFALGVAPHLLTDDNRKRLIEVVQEATDGQTMRQLYLDLGLIKDASARGGYHPSDKSPPTAAEKTDAYKVLASADWRDAARLLAKIGLKPKESWRLLSKQEIASILSLLKTITQAMSEALKA